MTAALPPTSTPTPSVKPPPVIDQETVLTEFLGWLEAKDYRVCRVAWGDRKPVDESSRELAKAFLDNHQAS